MLRKCFSSSRSKFVKKIGVHLNLSKPLDIYDLRKILFGKFTAIEKELPFFAYMHLEKSQRATETANREILERLELSFDKEVILEAESMKDQITNTLLALKDVN